MSVDVIHGDCLEELKRFADCSIDSCVTDPPYGLGFMGKLWDHGVPGPAYWAEVLRVLKPGAHLLAFGGTRTHHRLMCAIEDAGFELRDMIGWLYGSGFPKSLDVSKAIDKGAGVEREDKFEGSFDRRAGPTGNKRCDKCGNWLISSNPCLCPRPQDEAQSAAAKQWQGWGTALKPAWEPIILARKPLIGTVAQNVLRFGTGALNIDACRIATDDVNSSIARRKGAINHLSDRPAAETEAQGVMASRQTEEAYRAERPGELLGRWPANLIHDGSEEVLMIFPESLSPGHAPAFDGGKGNLFRRENGGLGVREDMPEREFDIGSAARFYFCAKASASDREEGLYGLPDRVLAMSNQAKAELARGNLHKSTDGMNTGKVRKNHHPTVKPTALMRYLCRLVTPKGGIVLDPFMGSGSTGRGAVREGFSFIGIDLDSAYCEIARIRIHADAPLFTDLT